MWIACSSRLELILFKRVLRSCVCGHDAWPFSCLRWFTLRHHRPWYRIRNGLIALRVLHLRDRSAIGYCRGTRGDAHVTLSSSILCWKGQRGCLVVSWLGCNIRRFLLWLASEVLKLLFRILSASSNTFSSLRSSAMHESRCLAPFKLFRGTDGSRAQCDGL